MSTDALHMQQAVGQVAPVGSGSPVNGGHRSTTAELDQSIATLRLGKDQWAKTGLGQRIALLDAVTRRFVHLCDLWVELGLNAKGARHDAYARGWEWASGPLPIVRYLQRLRRTLAVMEQTGRPPLPGPLTRRPNGQISLQVYPASLYERLSTPGTTADVWMEPGVSEEEVLKDQAQAYRTAESVGRVCLVLGAGNISGIPVTDSLSKLFVDNQVVLLKMNPVNEYLGSLIEAALAPLVSAGHLRVAYGGVAEGAYLCQHPGIDCLHLTGSDRTYEAIVFGPGSEGQRRKRERRPANSKPFTAELGNVAPTIVVPGPWKQQDLRYQAQQIASHLFDSGSYSCSRTRVIVQDPRWRLRRDLLREIDAVLSRVQPRVAYYPGAREQHADFVAAHPHAQLCGVRRPGTLPWTLIPDLDAQQEDEICFTTESFCPVVAETTLEASSTADFVRRAVDFANQRLWGTLSACIVVHPQSLREPDVSQAVSRAVNQLRYGTVAINCLPGLGWGLTVPPWGSFPGNDPWDIQSGTGFVNNSFLFAHPQKTVVRAPFRAWPLPPWFPSRGASLAAICRAIVRYEVRPSARQMLEIFLAALR